MIMVFNAITEYAYLFKHRFSSMTFFIMYAVTCFLKLAVPFLIILVTYKKKVIGKVPKAYTYDIDQDARIKLSREYRNAGFMLYAAMPLSYISGLFRLMGSTNFAKEIGIGFCFDLIFTLAMFFIQAVNNSNLHQLMPEKDMAQGYFEFMCLIAKLVAVADISLELFMFIYEVYRLRNLTKQSIDVIVTYSEEKRRSIYHKRYFGVAMTSLSVIVASVLALSFLLPPKVCRE